MIGTSNAIAETAPSLEGDWDGILAPAPNTSIPIVLHIRGATATLDSPTQGSNGIPAELT